MTTTADIARRYITALAGHDLDGAIACWQPGTVDRFVGAQELIAPDEVRQYFGELFAAFPDFSFEILDLTTHRARCAVRWRARGTFAGLGTFMGFAPNGASIDLEGCDVVTVTHELITHNDAYLNSGDLAREPGPAAPSARRPTPGSPVWPTSARACAGPCTASTWRRSPTGCGSSAVAFWRGP